MKRRNFFLPKPLWSGLNEHAALRDIGASELLREILTQWLKKNKHLLKDEVENEKD